MCWAPAWLATMPGMTPRPADDTPAPHPYALLTPDVVLDALGHVGLHGDGRLMALASCENRVYQAVLEDGSRVVAKFYRPGRWSAAQILEEHAFAQELARAEVPMVAPLELAGASLHTHAGFPGFRQPLARRAPARAAGGRLGDAGVAGPLHRAAAQRGRGAGVRAPAGAGCGQLRPRAARMAAGAWRRGAGARRRLARGLR